MHYSPWEYNKIHIHTVHASRRKISAACPIPICLNFAQTLVLIHIPEQRTTAHQFIQRPLRQQAAVL